MRKKVTQWISGVLFSTFAVLIYLLLFQSYLFSDMLLKGLNRYILVSRSVKLEGTLQGGLLANSIGLSDIKLFSQISPDTLISAEAIEILDWEYGWDLNELILNSLSIDGLLVNSQHLSQIQNPDIGNNKPLNLVINQVQIKNGVLNLSYAGSASQVLVDNFDGNVWLIDGVAGLRIKQAELNSPTLYPGTIEIAGLISRNTSKTIRLEKLSLKSEEQDLELQADINGSNVLAHFKGEGGFPESIAELNIPNYITNVDINYEGNLELDEKELRLTSTGRLNVNNQFVPYDLRGFTRSKNGESLDLFLGTEFSHASVKASRDSSEYLNARADLFRFDVNPFLKNKKLEIIDPLGYVTLQGFPEEMFASLRLESFSLNNISLDSVLADLTIGNNRIATLTRGEVNLADNFLEITGSGSEDQLELFGSIGVSDFTFLPSLNSKLLISGNVDSDFSITGSMTQPRFSGEFLPQDFSVGDKFSVTGLGKIDVRLMKDGLAGDIALVGNEGLFMGDSLRSYQILANMANKTYSIEELHFQGNHNLFSISGYLDPDNFKLDKLHVIKGDNQLKLVDTVDVQKTSDGVYHIPESVLAFNLGGLGLRGNYHPDAGLEVSVNYELLDIGQIMDLFSLKQSFEGIATGTGSITGALKDPIFNAKLDLRNGVSLGYPSDSAQVDITLSQNKVFSNRIEAYRDGGSLVLMGQLPWGYKVLGDQIRTTPQNFSINLDNYLLKDLKFESIIGLPVSGRASGTLSIRGTPIQSKIDGEVEIANAMFDTLHFSQAYSNFIYEDNMLTLDSLSMISTWGYGNGIGQLPISLDIIADDRMAVSNRDMGLEFNFNLNEMPFLTSYISTIDAISGDFIGNMSFTGPFRAPIRNGKIRGHNAALAVSVLGNPITNIHSEVTLKDNTLSIDHFSANMQMSEGSTLGAQGALGFTTAYFGELIGVKSAQNYAGELTATGSIDLNSFFEPRFDVNLEAKEVYYRSTDGLIEAVADASLQFTGRDTLDVTAIVPVQRAVYYANFESTELYQQSISNVDDLIFKYSLETQFASDLIISNDQMEAEFEGELWLLDYGDGVMRFTGTLTAIDGGKFFYLGNELRITEGEIIFNSVDFNPQLNIDAEIEIDGVTVGLSLTGDMSEPELVIKSDETDLTPTDILTYLTINQKLVEVGFDTESALNPVESYSKMYIEKQVSKLARELSGLDIVDIDVASDSSSTTSFQLGHRLFKNLKVTGGLQPTADQMGYDFGFEYQINRKVSITTRINQDNEVELNGRLKFTY